MRILCTFPGRNGDLIWSLPTMRAISEHVGSAVDLQIPGEFAPLAPLLQQQPYLHEVIISPEWALLPERVLTPPQLAKTYYRTFHLGYRGWPSKPLPFEVQANLEAQWQAKDGAVPQGDLGRPWITAKPFDDAVGDPYPVTAGWSDCWFELKFGLCKLIAPAYEPFPIVCPIGSRWSLETAVVPLPHGGPRVFETDWEAAARFIQSARVFLGDCSALHVLAVALGTPVVLVEPMEARWNPIFYPLGMDGPQVIVVKGLDGRPTFDARHVADTMKQVLDAR